MKALAKKQLLPVMVRRDPINDADPTSSRCHPMDHALARRRADRIRLVSNNSRRSSELVASVATC